MKVIYLLALLITLANARDPRCPPEDENSQIRFIPHEYYPDKFYTCNSDGYLIEMHCIDGLEFDYELGVCNWPNRYQRTSITNLLRATKTITCTVDQKDAFIANYEDGCQSFYKCENGLGLPLACGKGFLFNSNINRCDHDYNVICKAPSPSRSYNIPTCDILRKGALFANHASNCKTFFMCTKDMLLKEHSCGDNLVFNAKIGACDWPQNVNCECEGESCYGAIKFGADIPIKPQVDDCPPITTACPPITTACPPITTACPPITTTPAVTTTSFPVTTTPCPPITTQCPPITTQCPPITTQCPPITTTCPPGVPGIPEPIPPCPPPVTPCPPPVTPCPPPVTPCPPPVTPCPPTNTPYPPCVPGIPDPIPPGPPPGPIPCPPPVTTPCPPPVITTCPPCPPPIPTPCPPC